MNSAVVCLIGLAAFFLAYRYYSGYLARRVFELRRDELMPAHEKEDGVDYVPTHRHVLFGHHYASIAGAAPIVGPAIAVIWGWVPALCWVIGGTIFMGAVHDFSILVMSVRHGGRSVGSIVGDVIAPRTRVLFLLVIFFLVMLVIAVFAKVIATLFIKQPGAVIPINFEILVALAIGYWCYKRKRSLLWPSVAALISLYAMVWVGVQVPVSLATLAGSHEFTLWVVVLLGYAFVASVLPVWVLLQPRDYINSHQLFVGLVGLIGGIMITQPVITAPAFNTTAPADAPAWFPFLFVTIACGAISGFHGLVSSGTTSKQLSCATDARLVGYGGMVGEGLLALIATLAVSAGLADWASHYDSFAAVDGTSNFVEGAATFLTGIGIPRGPGAVVAAVLVISFAATTLDTGVRIQRYVLQEVGELYSIAALRNRFVAGLVAVALPGALVLGGGATTLWGLFGSTNQLLAGLSLTVVTVWLYRSHRPWLHVGIPMLLIIFVASIAMIGNLRAFVASGDYLLAVIGAVVLGLQVWLIFEGGAAMRRSRSATPRSI